MCKSWLLPPHPQWKSHIYKDKHGTSEQSRVYGFYFFLLSSGSSVKLINGYMYISPDQFRDIKNMFRCSRTGTHTCRHRRTTKHTHTERQWECFLLLSGSLQWSLRFAPESLWSEPHGVCIRLASPPLPTHTHTQHTNSCQAQPTNTAVSNRVTKTDQVMQVIRDDGFTREQS